jgi:hypothetical protein
MTVGGVDTREPSTANDRSTTISVGAEIQFWSCDHGSAGLIPSPAAAVEALTSILGAPWFLSAVIDPTHPTHLRGAAYMI